MEIRKKTENNRCEMEIAGRLDTTTAPQLEETLRELFSQETADLVLDLEELDYVSSAGLRVLLFAQKSIKGVQGEMVLKNVKPEIMEVLEITGFTDILKIEQ